MAGVWKCHLQACPDFPCLLVMKAIWQAVILGCLCMALADAAEETKGFVWEAPKIRQSVFTPELGMLDTERDEYASNLANHAASMVIAAKATPESLAEARRLLALALQLSPRNKRALVVAFQLSKGMLPELAEGNYSPQAFARLLFSRGQILEQQGGAQNIQLARMFIHIAATMDPRNEDAVYASEVHRIDHGELDWSTITAPEPKAP